MYHASSYCFLSPLKKSFFLKIHFCVTIFSVPIIRLQPGETLDDG